MEIDMIVAPNPHEKGLHCSFCGQCECNVEVMIATQGCNICSDCVLICVTEINDYRKNKDANHE